MERVRIQPRIASSTLKKVRLVAIHEGLTLEAAIDWLLQAGLWWVKQKKNTATKTAAQGETDESAKP
jgi:hypothetical protein